MLSEKPPGAKLPARRDGETTACLQIEQYLLPYINTSYMLTGNIKIQNKTCPAKRDNE